MLRDNKVLKELVRYGALVFSFFQIVFICVCDWVHVCLGAHEEARGQLLGVVLFSHLVEALRFLFLARCVV